VIFTYSDLRKYLIPSARPVDLTVEGQMRLQASREIAAFEERLWLHVATLGVVPLEKTDGR